jgi:YfiH family protein
LIARSADGYWQPWPGREDLVAGFGGREPVPGQAQFVTVKQVHGKRVLGADALGPGFHENLEADALVVTRAGGAVAVRTADCVPVLLVSDGPRWAAAVHAGWRGTHAGIVREAMGAAAAAGVEAARISAAIGPAIGPCCYEVGAEVAEGFHDLGFAPRRNEAGNPVLDLAAINRTILVDAGVNADRILLCDVCTRCNPARCFSYRGEPGESGRQLSWVGFRAAPGGVR